MDESCTATGAPAASWPVMHPANMPVMHPANMASGPINAPMDIEPPPPPPNHAAAATATAARDEGIESRTMGIPTRTAVDVGAEVVSDSVAPTSSGPRAAADVDPQDIGPANPDSGTRLQEGEAIFAPEPEAIAAPSSTKTQEQMGLTEDADADADAGDPLDDDLATGRSSAGVGGTRVGQRVAPAPLPESVTSGMLVFVRHCERLDRALERTGKGFIDRSAR